MVLNVSNSDFDDDDLRDEPGPVTLKPDSSRFTTFLVLLIFAGVCNGMLYAFSSDRISDWMQGKWDWFPELILIPLMLLGLGLILLTLHAFLSLFNPLPVLTLSRRMIPLGGTAVLSWRFSGSTRSVRSVQITLKGIEEARYTRGTNTSTDESTFFNELLFESNDPITISEGETPLVIPTGTMHSFSAPNNKIKWKVRFAGEIPLWPDFKTDFSIRVVPHE